jgi:hypothetical protein
MIALIEKAVTISISLIFLALIGLLSLVIFLWYEADVIQKLWTMLFILILSHFLPLCLDWCNKKGISHRIEEVALFYKFLLY